MEVLEKFITRHAGDSMNLEPFFPPIEEHCTSHGIVVAKRNQCFDIVGMNLLRVFDFKRIEAIFTIKNNINFDI